MTTTTTATFWGLTGKVIHQDAPGSATNLAWCGARRQFRHPTQRDATAPTCPKCQAALRKGHPQAHGS